MFFFRLSFIAMATLPLFSSALPSPTCALNGVPCPTPTWPVTWNLTQSTIIQPSSTAFFMPNHTYGLISLDWTVANSIWFTGNTENTTCEATSITGCKMLKEAGLATRCFIYHNSELALQWLESQRVVMQDPNYKDFFLRYKDSEGNKGEVYNEPIRFGSQYFWDYTNSSASQYYITSILSTLTDPAVDGTFNDDVSGVPQEHPLVQKRINMTDEQLAQLQYATQATNMILIEELVAAGKYSWSAFGDQDSIPKGPTQANCASYMRARCDPAEQGRTLLINMDDNNVNQTLAAFLVARGPYSWIGNGWESDDRNFHDVYYLQPGTPLGLCLESPANVFSRVWTEGTAVIDCNTWTSSLPFPSLLTNN